MYTHALSYASLNRHRIHARFGTQWKGYKTKFQLGKNHDTAISKDTLVQLGSKLSSIPDGTP